MPNTYTELLKTTLGTATNSVTISSIPSGYTDLVLVINAGSSAGADANFRLNGDSGSNYSRTSITGNGSAAGSSRTSNAIIGRLNFNGYPFGAAGDTTIIAHFMNYANTTTYKTVISRANQASLGTDAVVNLWRSTAAINSIEILSTAAATYVAGSTFSLYGIANADLGSAKATGGIITEDANYWYHTFGASGAFIPKQSLTCDVLVVAGGGGGGDNIGGGGGGGGLRVLTSQSVSSGVTYTTTVGGGGSGGPGGGGQSNGTKGTNSSFSGAGFATITSTGGGYGAIGDANGGPGGSGGGTRGVVGNGGTGNEGGYTPVEGFSGNKGAVGTTAGGGGGAAAIGQLAPSSTQSGAGGVGSTTYSSWGTVTGVGQNVSGTYYLAGGGGGGGFSALSVLPGDGGLGGGGGGGNGTTVGTSGTPNTGGGGGGGTSASGTQYAGGAGGSGVVIVRYAK